MLSLITNPPSDLTVEGPMQVFKPVYCRDNVHVCLTPRPAQEACMKFDDFQKVKLEHSVLDEHRLFENVCRLVFNQPNCSPWLVFHQLDQNAKEAD